MIQTLKTYHYRLVYLLPLIGFLLVLTACEREPEIEKSQAPLMLQTASFDDLPGWTDDNMDGVVQAFSKSCKRILRRADKRQFGPQPVGGTYKDWDMACMEITRLEQLLGYSEDMFANVDPDSYEGERMARMKAFKQAQGADGEDSSLTPEQKTEYIRNYFETFFKPYMATTREYGPEGLFTGYYEASLDGSLEKTDQYHYPLYARPSDLVMVDLGEFRDDLKGRRIAGRVINGRLRIYEDRADIDAGGLPEDLREVIAWVDDPVDAFFLHIQGSGVVTLPDGERLRVGYAGQNGHPYFAIGRDLIERGALTKDTVSMQTIRQWLDENPAQAEEVMHKNPSYVFFRKLEQDAPIGGEGLELTPHRSLAIDRSKIPYGVPVWVDIEPPLDGEDPIKRLMIAQDTGGAIRGAVRGDVFWGYGERAEHLAGHMKSKGQYWLLLPKTKNELKRQAALVDDHEGDKVDKVDEAGMAGKSIDQAE